MDFDSAASSPVVGVVVVGNVAEHEAGFRAVKDEPEVEVDAGGPEVFVFRLFDAMKLKARLGGV